MYIQVCSIDFLQNYHGYTHQYFSYVVHKLLLEDLTHTPGSHGRYDMIYCNYLYTTILETSLSICILILCCSRSAELPEDGCFGELLPSRLGEYSHLRLYERSAQLFVRFVGAKGGVKMGSSAFRTFTR